MASVPDLRLTVPLLPLELESDVATDTDPVIVPAPERISIFPPLEETDAPSDRYTEPPTPESPEPANRPIKPPRPLVAPPELRLIPPECFQGSKYLFVR